MTENSLIRFASFTPNSLQFPNAWVGHLPFAAWVMQQVLPRIFVELGTHSGNSYFSFCQSVVESGISSKCYAVDTWQGEEHAGIYDETVFQQVSAHNQAHYASFSRLLRMTFDDARAYFSDGSVDLLHIDGFHTYEAVKHDFETWLPKLAPGAVVLFHDINVRERGFGVWKLWEELQQRYPNNIEFLHSHGLGVLQIAGATENKKLVWLHATFNEQKQLKDYFSSLGTSLVDRYELRQVEAIIANLNHALTVRDGQINDLNQMVWVRDGQINDLNQMVEVRDGQINDLNQIVTVRDGQIKDLKQTLAEHQKQIGDLNQMITSRDEQITSVRHERDYAVANFAAVRRSKSWRLTAPMRFLGHLIKGDFVKVKNIVKAAMSYFVMLLPQRMQTSIRRQLSGLHNRSEILLNSSDNYLALAAIVSERCALTKAAPSLDSLCAPLPPDPPAIDISAVTFNSSHWLVDFVDSLMALNYPKHKLTIRFVDNGSTDSTLDGLRAALLQLESAGCTVEIIQRPNRGFGAGHNVAIQAGTSPFCLVTNVDLVFETHALEKVVATAHADVHAAVAWELRQKPYEHPKFYDPITGTTNWNSHACVLIRRSAIIKVGGYDESLFMYGEDVELSYRLRRAGYLLRYCPAAIVHHYSYDHESQIKPLQYTGSTFANLYIRLKYGNWKDVMAVPLLGLKLLFGPQAFPGSRKAVFRNLIKLLYLTPRALLARRSSKAHLPFRSWDYEMSREGAFVPTDALPSDRPTVSIITRTYQGRSLYLRQAILSVAHQTYPCVELIVVEDGGETQRQTVEEMSAMTGKTFTYLALEKVGRSAAGNAGLSAATGKWCLFLDDDDLLFADHIEVLVSALQKNQNSLAAYSLSWEIMTDSLRFNQGEYTEVTHALPSVMRQPFDRTILLHHNYMAIQSVLFERQLYLERGGFEEDMDALEDWMLWIKYSENNDFIFIPKITSMYRVPACANKIRQRMDVFGAAYPLALARVGNNHRSKEDQNLTTMIQS